MWKDMRTFPKDETVALVITDDNAYYARRLYEESTDFSQCHRDGTLKTSFRGPLLVYPHLWTDMPPSTGDVIDDLLKQAEQKS